MEFTETIYLIGDDGYEYKIEEIYMIPPIFYTPQGVRFVIECDEKIN